MILGSETLSHPHGDWSGYPGGWTCSKSNWNNFKSWVIPECYRPRHKIEIPLTPGEYYYFYRSSFALQPAKGPLVEEDAPPVKLEEFKRTKCANEGGVCSCVGLVFYGHFPSQRWTTMFVSEYWGMLPCENYVFGGV